LSTGQFHIHDHLVFVMTTQSQFSIVGPPYRHILHRSKLWLS
jgi:hypothetical protein